MLYFIEFPFNNFSPPYTIPTTTSGNGKQNNVFILLRRYFHPSEFYLIILSDVIS